MSAPEPTFEPIGTDGYRWPLATGGDIYIWQLDPDSAIGAGAAKRCRYPRCVLPPTWRLRRRRVSRGLTTWTWWAYCNGHTYGGVLTAEGRWKPALRSVVEANCAEATP